MAKKKYKYNILPFLSFALLLAAALLIVPVIHNPELGYDTPTHISRSRYLRENMPYVEWNWWWSGGMPYQLYPPITYYSVVLFSSVLPLIEAYITVVNFAFALTLLFTYLLIHEWSGSYLLAAVGSSLLASSWIFLGSYYVAGQLPNNLAIAFFPLFFICFDRATQRIGREGHIYTALAGLTLGAIALTHHLSIFPFLLMFGLYLLVNPSRIPFRRILIRAFLIGISGLTVSSFFMIPFIDSILAGETIFYTSWTIPIASMLIMPSSFYAYRNFIGYPLIVCSAIALIVNLLSIIPKYRWMSDKKAILALLWSAALIFLTSYPADIGFIEVHIQSHRLIFFLPFPLTIAAAQGIKPLTSRLLKRYQRRDLAVLLLMLISLASLAFGFYGVEKMVRESPFKSADDEAQELANYLNSHSEPWDIIVFQTPYVTNLATWFNVFTDLAQVPGVEPQAVVNRRLVLSLTYALTYDNVTKIQEIMEKIGARYLIADSGHVDPFVKAGYQVVFKTTPLNSVVSTYILKINSSKPVFLEIGSGELLSLTRSTDQIKFKIRIPEETNVVVKTSYHRFWHAYADGKPVVLNPTEYGFIRFKLTASGIHTITLQYSCYTRMIFGFITVISSIGLIVYAVILKLWKIPMEWNHTKHQGFHKKYLKND